MIQPRFECIPAEYKMKLLQIQGSSKLIYLPSTAPDFSSSSAYSGITASSRFRGDIHWDAFLGETQDDSGGEASGDTVRLGHLDGLNSSSRFCDALMDDFSNATNWDVINWIFGGKGSVYLLT